MMKATKITAGLVTLSMLIVGLAAVAPSAGAQDAPEVPGNCYEGDGDLVAVSANGQNVHGDHNGGNAVDVALLHEQETSGDDNDLVDVNGGLILVGLTPLSGTRGEDHHSGEDCDTVDVDVGTWPVRHDGDDSDTVDADVQTFNYGGSSGDDDDTVDVGVNDNTYYVSQADNDTVDVRVGDGGGDSHQNYDDDTFSCDVKADGDGPLPFPGNLVSTSGNCAGQDFQVP